MKQTFRSAFVFLAFISMLGCPGGPTLHGQSGPKPAWVDTPPAEDASYMYFVGTGYSSTANAVEAEKAAAQELIDQVMRFIGVKITSKTRTEAKATVDTFTANLTREMVQSGSAQISGFKVVEKYQQTSAGGNMTFFILARYDKKDLLEQKAYIRKLFDETVEAVSIPEKQGAELAAQGSYYEAALRFIEAAVAAKESQLDNAAIYFNRNIDNAMRAMEKITLVKVNDNLTGNAGGELADVFKLRVVSGSAGVPNVTIRVSYKMNGASGKPVANSAQIRTDDSGLAVFRHPLPNFVGQGSVIMSIDISAYAEKLDNAPREFQDKRDALLALVSDKRVEFSFTVASRAKGVASGVLIVDTDNSGQALASPGETMSGFLEFLTSQGFTVTQIALEPEVLVGRSDMEIVGILKEEAGGNSRIMYGKASIVEYSMESGSFIFTVTGNIKVLDLATGRVVYEKTIKKRATGSSVESARSAAFKALGKDLAKAVASDVK